MKKIFLTSFGVLIVLIGFIAILHFLPCKDGACYGEKRGHCAVDGKHEGCEGKGHGCDPDSYRGKAGCEGKGHGCDSKGSCERKGDHCGDGHGKMHKEIRIEMHGDGACAHGEMGKGCGHGKMNAACSGHGNPDSYREDGGKCMMPGMEMGCPVMGGCCCCMMMHGGMMHKGMCGMDSVVKKDSVVIIRK